MIVLKPPVEKKELVFGDFVSLHVERDKDQARQPDAPKNHLMHYEALFTRIGKERGNMKASNHVHAIVMHVDKRQRGILPNTLPRQRAG